MRRWRDQRYRRHARASATLVVLETDRCHNDLRAAVGGIGRDLKQRSVKNGLDEINDCFGIS
jgi:hypothetical protein